MDCLDASIAHGNVRSYNVFEACDISSMEHQLDVENVCNAKTLVVLQNDECHHYEVSGSILF